MYCAVYRLSMISNEGLTIFVFQSLPLFTMFHSTPAYLKHMKLKGPPTFFLADEIKTVMLSVSLFCVLCCVVCVVVWCVCMCDWNVMYDSWVCVCVIELSCVIVESVSVCVCVRVCDSLTLARSLCLSFIFVFVGLWNDVDALHVIAAFTNYVCTFTQKKLTSQCYIFYFLVCRQFCTVSHWVMQYVNHLSIQVRCLTPLQWSHFLEHA